MNPSTCRQGYFLKGDAPSRERLARTPLSDSYRNEPGPASVGVATEQRFTLLIQQGKEGRTDNVVSTASILEVERGTERASEKLRAKNESVFETTGERASDVSGITELRPEFVAAAVVAGLFAAISRSAQAAVAARAVAARGRAAEQPLSHSTPAAETAEIRFRSTAPNEGTAEIDLRYPGLGRVRLELTLVQHDLDVVALVNRPQAAEAIRRSENDLRLRLAAQGIELKTLRIQTVNPRKKTAEHTKSRQGRALKKENER